MDYSDALGSEFAQGDTLDMGLPPPPRPFTIPPIPAEDMKRQLAELVRRHNYVSFLTGPHRMTRGRRSLLAASRRAHRCALPDPSPPFRLALVRMSRSLRPRSHS